LQRSCNNIGRVIDEDGRMSRLCVRPRDGRTNRAEALRVYAKCRKLFRDELGATPSPQTEAVFLQILRAAE
jgi:transcriptional activator